jgi:hypothetical protein
MSLGRSLSWHGEQLNPFGFIILFVNERENLGKGSNLEPLVYKGDFNHCISFFPLKIM